MFDRPAIFLLKESSGQVGRQPGNPKRVPLVVEWVSGVGFPSVQFQRLFIRWIRASVGLYLGTDVVAYENGNEIDVSEIGGFLCGGVHAVLRTFRL